MDDAWVRTAARLLTVLALVAFVGWIATIQHGVLLAAILLAVAAYAFFLADRRRHVEEPAGYGSDRHDRVMEGSETAVIPGVSVGGIHMSFETRTRWRTKR